MNLQKEFRIDSDKLRKSARGEICTFNITGVCSYDSETTVLCHSGEIDDGKGKGRKGSDLYAAFGCSACHTYYDNPANPDRLFYFHRALKRTWKRWIEMGLIKVMI